MSKPDVVHEGVSKVEIVPVVDWRWAVFPTCLHWDLVVLLKVDLGLVPLWLILEGVWFFRCPTTSLSSRHTSVLSKTSLTFTRAAVEKKVSKIKEKGNFLEF